MDDLETTALQADYEPKYKIVSFSENPLKYSPIERETHDRERHIPAGEAYALINSLGELDSAKLETAAQKGEIRVYDFNGEQYFDRLDIGRVYHKEVERSGLSVPRHFTKPGESPLDSVIYTKRHLRILDFKTKQVEFEMPDAEMPEWMNDTEASIVASKYLFKPSKKRWKDKLKIAIGSDHEYSLKHLNKRVADFFADEGWRLGYFKTEEDRENFRNELYFLQANGAGAFNSPTQFNAGLFNSYGIEGSTGLNYWRDPKTGEIKKVQNGEYVHPQLHACFIHGPEDNLESIAQNVGDEMAIFSLGSGIGQDIGKLRGEGEGLSGGGKSSGVMSFFRIYDEVAKAIKSGGKTRRAARMATMRYNHPDIMKFIRGKLREDLKALTLIQSGKFSGGMDGEAYMTVAFQNTNLSVRVDDEFFEILKKGGEVQLYNVNNGKPNGKVSAERMLKEIAFGSWRIGDPAIQYESKIQEMHTAKSSGRQNSTNPCSEYLFLDDTSCSLFSMRLTYFMNEDRTFNVDNFRNALRTYTIAQNIANEAASYPVPVTARISTEFGTIGAGYADLGSLLMRQGIPYDSEKGRAVAGAITSLLTGTVYETSAEIAKALGPFIHFEFNKKPMLEVMQKHQGSLDKILWDEIGDEKLKSAAYESWQKAIEMGERSGYRNAQASVLAPTGTISYLMACSTTGGEPAMSIRAIKNLAGGGNIVVANKDVEIALRRLGYTAEQIEDISKYVGKRNTLINAPHVKQEHYPVFDTAFGNENGEGSIKFEGHVRMVGAIQPFISGAISKTNNLPESATVKDIYDGYLLGHELGLKAISIFRNNSKPISAVGFGGGIKRKLQRGEKEEPPFSGNAFRQEIKINNTPFLIEIGEYKDGRPAEVVINSYTSDSTLGALLRVAGIDASTSLKRGISLENVVKGWLGHGFEPRGFVRVENEQGKEIPHPYIKQATSPLDFVSRLLLLHYKGMTDMATEPEGVNIRDLRGFNNGAFEVYEMENIDAWDVDDVLNNPKLGGFTDKNGEEIILIKKDGARGNNNHRGVLCSNCGNVMNQTASNCFECKNCGDKIGGCGA